MQIPHTWMNRRIKFEEEVNPDGDDPEVQPSGYWASSTRFVQFANRVESESSREDENPPVQSAKENDQDHELADAVPSDSEKKEVGQMLAEATAALEVAAMDSGDLRRQQLSMRSSEQQKREEAKEEKKKEKETQKNVEAKPKGRPKKLQVEDKNSEEPCHPPDAPKRLRKRQKSVPDLADQGLAAEAPAQEAAPKKKTRPKKSTAKAARGSAEVVAAAECLSAKKKRREGLRKKPAQSVEKKELEPEVEQAARTAEVVAEAPPKKKKKTKGKKDQDEEEVVAEAPPKKKKKKKKTKGKKDQDEEEVVAEAPPTKKKKTKGKKDQDKEAEVPPLAEDEERTKKTKKDTAGRRSRAEPAPGTVDEKLKKEMVALLQKWQGKEYDRNEDTYHSSDEFGEAISFTVYWNRPAVGIKIWDYEEKEWTQRAYFAKYSLTLCIFMARKFALQLFKKGLDWGTEDEGIALRNDLKATAAAAEAAVSSM